MYSKIIVGYDGSAQADDALALGKLIAGATGASLTAVTVFQSDPMWGGYDVHFQDLDAERREKLEKGRGRRAPRPRRSPRALRPAGSTS